MTGRGVRRATLDDAAAVATLQVRSWQVAYRGLVPDAFLDTLTEDAWLGRWSEELAVAPPAGVHRLVSTAPDDSPRAVAVCGPARDGDSAPVPVPVATATATAQLYVLYADPAVWGRGHGSALLREVHVRLAADGHARALLWVAASNQRAIGFYTHHGWAADGARQREEVAGTPFDELRMVRDLT